MLVVVSVRPADADRRHADDDLTGAGLRDRPFLDDHVADPAEHGRAHRGQVPDSVRGRRHDRGRRTHSPPPPFAGELVSHNDLNLDNVVFGDGRAVSLIDFDLAGLGSPVWDVACAARLWAPLRPNRWNDESG
jgi:phosphotransferase family enzyme